MSAPVQLAEVTTFRCGGPAAQHTTVTTDTDLIDTIKKLDAAGTAVLIVGGGSNMLVGPDPLLEHVVLVRTDGITEVARTTDSVTVRVAAGVVWDEFVAHTVAHGWAGVEALSGIPGSVGATPIQNVGAYGQEIATTVTSVEVWDRQVNQSATMTPAECAFQYRDSVFKQTPGRWVILAVHFELSTAAHAPVAYGQLATALGVQVGDHADPATVRESVLALRAGKGMVLDAQDHDTWSAGSFFTNPIVPTEVIPADAPNWPVTDTHSKTSAAWLIDHAGFSKGFGLPGPASLSTKHTLALTNRGSATADDVLAVAATVRDGVYATYGIELVPEPNLVHCVLPPLPENGSTA